MKKKSILSFFALLALTACNGSGTSLSSTSSSNGALDVSSSESSSSLEDASSSSSNVTGSNSASGGENSSLEDSSSKPVEKNDWTDDQKKTMSEHLHNVVLPYINAGEGTIVSYDEKDKLVTIRGTSQLTSDDLKNYASLYSTDNGWINSSDQYSNLSNNVYAFQKKISTDEGNRYVEVEFSAVNQSSNFSNNGVFSLVAYDPFIYDFPAEFFDLYIQYNTNSQLHVPSFPAEYYILSDEEPKVFCITSDEQPEEKYKQILQGQKFITLDETDKSGYWYSYSSDKKFVVAFKYNSEKKQFEIGYASKVPSNLPTPDWPSKSLVTAFSTYSQDPFDVPQMSFDGATYLGREDLNNEYYLWIQEETQVNYIIEVHNAKQENFNEYVNTTLPSNSWTLDNTRAQDSNDGTKVFTKEISDKIATIDVKFDSETNIVLIHVYLYLTNKTTA